MSFSTQFLNEVQEIAKCLDSNSIEQITDILAETRSNNGRLFVLGVGGSAANALHAVCDFRKIAGIEAYSFDNLAELTARTNDEGWPTVFEKWLEVSHLNEKDTLLIFSVGGGNLEKNVSPNLVAAMQLAEKRASKIIAIVGRDGGYAAQVADACVLIPTINPAHITPHAEAFQAVVWHLLVSHPKLKQVETKWESVSNKAVFLDRDGTLIKFIVASRAEQIQIAPTQFNDLEIFPEALEALTLLKNQGFKLIMVTNQPDISRGKCSKGFVDLINEAIALVLPLDHIYVCPHSDEDKCDCRKPGIGMFTQAAADLGIDLKRSYMIGDTWRDINAGKAANCKTVWVHRSETPVENMPVLVGDSPNLIVASLTEAVAWILEDSK